MRASLRKCSSRSRGQSAVNISSLPKGFALGRPECKGAVLGTCYQGNLVLVLQLVQCTAVYHQDPPSSHQRHLVQSPGSAALLLLSNTFQGLPLTTYNCLAYIAPLRDVMRPNTLKCHWSAMLGVGHLVDANLI